MSRSSLLMGVAFRLSFGLLAAHANAMADNVPASTNLAASPDALEEVIVQARGPRYVAATTRDRIGRIWAPVFINDKGPFRLVLDTGASSSGVIVEVAQALGIALNESPAVTLRGVTGSAVVPSIKVESMVMGDLLLTGKRLPIITDALGGAEGVLGNEGLQDKRIDIDFRHDSITITRSRSQRAAEGFITIPVEFMRGRLLTIKASMGSVPVRAIIDTGGQVTIGNMAMRDALSRSRLDKGPSVDIITGATADEEQGEGYAAPPIRLGGIQIYAARITFGDLHIFKHWQMTNEPALLVGMDALGLLDTLIIDYKLRELQIKMRS